MSLIVLVPLCITNGLLPHRGYPASVQGPTSLVRLWSFEGKNAKIGQKLIEIWRKNVTLSMEEYLLSVCESYKPYKCTHMRVHLDPQTSEMSGVLSLTEMLKLLCVLRKIEPKIPFCAEISQFREFCSFFLISTIKRYPKPFQRDHWKATLSGTATMQLQRFW